MPFEVVNGVSSLNLALAKMGLDVAQVVFFSQHASRPQRLERCGGRALAVFPPLDAEGRLRLWEELRGCEVYLLERLSLPGERARRVESAEELVSADPLAVVVAKCLN
nr:hypothetical protein [Pyrobaculum neutrophilum]